MPKLSGTAEVSGAITINASDWLNLKEAFEAHMATSVRTAGVLSKGFTFTPMAHLNPVSPWPFGTVIRPGPMFRQWDKRMWIGAGATVAMSDGKIKSIPRDELHLWEPVPEPPRT